MKIFVIKFFAFYLACLSCYILQTSFGLNPILCAALIGFAGSFYNFSGRIEKTGMHAIIYAGAFAGMCSQEYLSGHKYIVFISIVGSGLYLLTKSHFQGFGGKLGAVAFVSSMLLILSRSLW